MTNNPAYGIGDKVYLRESAALGFLEAVQISSIRSGARGNWLYSYQQVPRAPKAISTYGDRRSFTNGRLIWLDETEIISYCAALALAQTNLQAQLATLQNLIRSYNCG